MKFANALLSAAGAVLLLAAMAGPGGAQSTGSTSVRPGQNNDYSPTWTIEQALPGKPAAQSRPVPRISAQSPTRVPLETGSFGLETKSQFRQNQFSDGRTIPGLEARKRDDPSYFGLSLQVPTNNVPLLPLLSPPNPNR
ncbi:MAG: hypothetical protein FJX62_11830 [Alphaproteobacteria bacterium]|nr:hypothetical protein [Alphaproteobacteria bacterium]